MDWVCALAPTAGSSDSVIAALARGEASFSREVAEDTGEEEGEERHGGPADAAVRLRAREGLVRARVLVVAGAVVEKPLDAANARPVLHRALRRAHAPAAAHPAGGEHPWATAVRTPAPPAVLAPVGVFTRKSIPSPARRDHNRPRSVIQRFQLVHTGLRTFGLGSDYLLTGCRAAEEPLARGGAAYAGPDATLRVLGAGGPHHAFPGGDGSVCIAVLSQRKQVPEIIGPLLPSLQLLVGPRSRRHRQVIFLLSTLSGRRPLSNCGPVCVLVATPAYPNLIQR